MQATAINYRQDVNDEKHGVEIVVHIDEDLDALQRQDLAATLEDSEGIDTCVFCEHRFHLMLVNYDRNQINSQAVLARIRKQGLNAKLIGPI
ncbi:MAG: hypothetical protein R3308_04575 [Thiohalobacterales bacterium]|nr:hypothetical protein [Thiohalobacterales bacterium]